MPRFLQNAETDWLPFSSRSRKIVKYLLRSACSDFFMRMSFRYDVISFTKINPPIHRSPWGYSKGTKKLKDWIQSSYCRKRGINQDTVAEVVKEALSVGR